MRITQSNTRVFIATAALALVASSPLAFAQTAMTPDHDQAKSMDSDQPVTDTWITTKVKSELATTKGVSSADITVTTVNGVVTLTGMQDNKIAIDKAVAVAKAVKGVKSVDHAALKTKA